jgi:hypothetical protein
MQSSLKHKLAVGGLVGGLVLSAGAVAGGAIGLGAVSGNDSVRDLAESTSLTSPSTPDDSVPNGSETRVDGDETETRTFVDVPDGTSQTFGAGPAGTVTVSRAGGVLTIVSADPAAGWVISEREDSGREVEVTFVNGGVRVKFDVELEDGAVRVRVRQRGLTDGTLPGTTPPTVGDDDNSGPGDNRGSGSDDVDDDDSDDSDDNSGPGSAGDDSGHDDDGGSDNSGRGGGDD